VRNMLQHYDESEKLRYCFYYYLICFKWNQLPKMTLILLCWAEENRKVGNRSVWEFIVKPIPDFLIEIYGFAKHYWVSKIYSILFNFPQNFEFWLFPSGN
jgi:hypothetical protein